MKTHHSSSSAVETLLVSFRCPKELIEHIINHMERFNISRSELIRGAIELSLVLLREHARNQLNSLNVELLLDRYFSCHRCHPVEIREASSDSSLLQQGKYHHITKLNKEYHSFHGFRVAICYEKVRFCRYFSVAEYGSEPSALKAAVSVRDHVLNQLPLHPEHIAAIYADAMVMLPPPHASFKRRIRKPITGSPTYA